MSSVSQFGIGNKRKRVIRSTITITSGASSNTYTISPALSSLDLVDVRFLGPATATTTLQTCGIVLSSTTTLTAFRGGSTTQSVDLSFEITEYLP